MSGIYERTHAQPVRTDSRPLAERKHSATARIAELRRALLDAERAEAEITIAIEAEERRREAQARAAERGG